MHNIHDVKVWNYMACCRVGPTVETCKFRGRSVSERAGVMLCCACMLHNPFIQGGAGGEGSRGRGRGSHARLMTVLCAVMTAARCVACLAWL